MFLTTVTTADHIATLTIAPSDGLADGPFDDALAAAAAQIAADTEAIRAVVVTGSETTFCAGWSAQTLAAATASPPPVAGINALAAIPQPVVAAIEGSAHAAGLEIALACDIRVAAADASFAMPETSLGTVPRGGGTQRLPRYVGKSKAMEMLLTGRMMDAEEAERAGLVSRIVAKDSLLDEAVKVAGRIAGLSRPSVFMAKESVNRAYESSLAEGIRFERRMFHSTFGTEDQKEGMAAFIEKRKPAFKNR